MTSLKSSESWGHRSTLAQNLTKEKLLPAGRHETWAPDHLEEIQLDNIKTGLNGAQVYTGKNVKPLRAIEIGELCIFLLFLYKLHQEKEEFIQMSILVHADPGTRNSSCCGKGIKLYLGGMLAKSGE